MKIRLYDKNVTVQLFASSKLYLNVTFLYILIINKNEMCGSPIILYDMTNIFSAGYQH